jgi:hypothetical protein
MGIKLAKIAVTAEADQALEDMVSKVNDGFLGGKIGKQELASFAIMHFARESIEGSMEAVRAAHFDELAYLDAVVKQLRSAKRTGGAPADIRAMLAPLVTAPRQKSAAAKSKDTSPS